MPIRDGGSGTKIRWHTSSLNDSFTFVVISIYLDTWHFTAESSPVLFNDVNKDFSPKATDLAFKTRAKDLTLKAKDLSPKGKSKDLSLKAKYLGLKAKSKDLSLKAKDLGPKAKDLGLKATSKDHSFVGCPKGQQSTKVNILVLCRGRAAEYELLHCTALKCVTVWQLSGATPTHEVNLAGGWQALWLVQPVTSLCIVIYRPLVYISLSVSQLALKNESCIIPGNLQLFPDTLCVSWLILQNAPVA